MHSKLANPRMDLPKSALPLRDVELGPYPRRGQGRVASLVDAPLAAPFRLVETGFSADFAAHPHVGRASGCRGRSGRRSS